MMNFYVSDLKTLNFLLNFVYNFSIFTVVNEFDGFYFVSNRTESLTNLYYQRF